jgi:hypothetical protein
MLRDILVTSDEEAQRLLAAFKSIPNMQGRLKIVELAERMAREKRTLRMTTHAPAHMPR